MTAEERLLDRIDRRGLIGLARSLVRIPTPNPPGDERRAVVYLEPRLRRMGFRLQRVITPAGRWNLLAERGFGPPSRGVRPRTFLFNGHLDVVPVGDEAAWKHPPFAARVSGGKLWGRGSADMKGGIAAFLAAAQAVARSGLRSPHRLAIHLVSDEEALGAEGTGYLVSRKLARADLAVVGEPTGLEPVVAAKGTLRGTVRVLGRAAHSSTPERGVNAIGHAARLVERLSRLRWRARHPLLGRPTLVVATIQGGVRSNVVPPECTLQFDRRVLPGEKAADIKREIAGVIAALKKAHPDFRARVEFGKLASASEIPARAEVVRLAAEALRAVGRRPRLTALSGTTDARFLIRQARIPTLILGPGALAQAHAANEHLRVDELEEAARVYAIMLGRFLEAS